MVLPDRYIEHGSPSDQLAEAGLTGAQHNWTDKRSSGGYVMKEIYKEVFPPPQTVRSVLCKIRAWTTRGCQNSLTF